MKIIMTTSERGSEDGVTIRVFGPGEVDIVDSLARDFIIMGIAHMAEGSDEREVSEPRPVEVASGNPAEHPRRRRPKKGQ